MAEFDRACLHMISVILIQGIVLAALVGSLLAMAQSLVGRRRRPELLDAATLALSRRETLLDLAKRPQLGETTTSANTEEATV